MWNGCTQPLNAFAKWSPSNGDQKRRYLLHVRHLRVWREISHLHVFGHALPKGCHKRLLCEMECAASSLSMLSQNGVLRAEMKTAHGTANQPPSTIRATKIPRSGLVHRALCC